MKDKKYMTAPEIKLMLIETLDVHHEKLRKDLPTILAPMMEDVAEKTAHSFGKKLGIDFESIDSMDKYHRQKDFVQSQMELQSNIKRTVLSSVGKFSLAGIMGWAASKFFGGN